MKSSSPARAISEAAAHSASMKQTAPAAVAMWLLCIAAAGALVLGACASGNSTRGAADAGTATSDHRGVYPGAGALTQQEMHDYRPRRASELLGQGVIDSRGKLIGTVRDLVLDMRTGEVRYAILSAAGAAPGDTLYAVSVRRLRTTDMNEIFADIDVASLAQQKSFSSQHWPGMEDTTFWGEVDRLSGVPAVQPAQAYYAFRASRLIGRDVDNRGGRHLGRIADLMIDMNRQRVDYAVLRQPNAAGAPDRALAVPIRALLFPGGDKSRLALDMTQEELDGMTAFDADKWPVLKPPRERN